MIPIPELWESIIYSLPLPDIWEWYFFIPSPFPNCGNGSISFPSRILGMELSIPVPVPKLQKFCSYNRASTYLIIIAQVVGPARSSCAEVKQEERLIDVFSEGPLAFFLGKKDPSQSLYYLPLCGRHLVGNSVIISGLPAPTSRGSLSITPPPCTLRLPSCKNICKIL